MMQDVHVKFNPGLRWQKQHSTERLFYQHTGLKFKEQTGEVLRLDHCIVW
jgi:hypothetical protein